MTILQRHEKFFAFIILIAAVLLILWMGDRAPATGTKPAEVLRFYDTALGGLMLALGAAATALFRTSSVDQNQSEALKNLSQKTPPPTGEAREALLEPSVPEDPEAPSWTR